MKVSEHNLFSLVICISLLPLCAYLCSCTLSYQNIATHGTATDVVDDTLTTDVKTNPTITAELPLPTIKSAIK